MKRGIVRGLAATLSIFALALALGACGSNSGAGEQASDAAADETAPAAEAQTAEATEVRVGSLKGPTSIGIASLMDRAAAGELANDYDFTVAGTADEIVPAIISGDLDIALVPANVASVLYNRTEGGVMAIDVNTLGVLSVVTGDASVDSFESLAGRTVYLTGKGTTPEYVMEHLIEATGVEGVTLEFKSEASEVVATLAADPTAVGVLPQPYVTAATTQNPDLVAAVDLTDVWDGVADDGSMLVTGVTVVRSEFAQEHPEAVAEFVSEQAASVEAANADPEAVAKLVVEAGIMDNEAVVAKAIPACHLVCLTGVEMRSALSGYLEVLYLLDPSSVGGTQPPDNFYYLG